MSARRRWNRSVRPYAALMAFVFTWTSANSQTSRGASEHSAAQSGKLDRNACGTAPISRSRTSFAMASLERSPPRAEAKTGVFAVAGLLLAVVGGIGHIADFVVRESHSTAVRTALGADPDLLVWGAFGSTACAAVVGVAIGTLFGWMLSRAVAARVQWIETGDPLFYLGPAALLLLLMLAASAIAGLRTLRGDPWAALRSL